MRRAAWAAMVCGVVCTGLLSLRAQDKLDTSLPALLDRLGRYVDQYEQDLAMVVSEEHYRQEVTGNSELFVEKRELKSDFLLSKAGDKWIAFRDVLAVNGQEVNDRPDRLVNLFLKPTGDSKEQINKIVAESARHNVGWVNRNINVPTMVLQFAKSTEQSRSEFKRGDKTDIEGIDAREIRFQEKKLPRVIQTRDGAAAQGKFWVEEATGRVIKTELRVTTGNTSATVVVLYQFQPKLKILLPMLMNERYVTPRQPVITGRATYQNFRQFNVLVDQVIK
jgi:hypothetical protein